MISYNKANNPHNYEVDFWRFVFSLIVVVLHSIFILKDLAPSFIPFQGGAVAVEFFLLLSGFFMIKSLDSIKSNHVVTGENCGYLALKFTWRKIKSLLPYVALSVVMVYSIYAIINRWSYGETLKQFTYSIYEILLLPMTGIRVSYFNLPLWYLSCLMIVLPVLAYIILKARDFYIHVFAFVSSAMIYGYIILTYKSIDTWNKWIGWTYTGVLRVIAGLCLGSICYLLYKKLREFNFTKTGLWVLTFLHISCFTIAIIRMYFSNKSRLDIIIVMLLFIAVSIMFTQKSYFSKHLNNKVFGFLGKISLPLYTSHWGTIQIILKYFSNQSYAQRLSLYILFSFVLALFLYLLVEAVRWFHPLQRLKKLLIVETEV